MFGVWFTLNVFCAGVSFTLIACSVDGELAARSPIWWHVLSLSMCAGAALSLRKA